MNATPGMARDHALIPEDVVLLLLAAPGRSSRNAGRLNGITRLEKLLFLAEKEGGVRIGEGEPFAFRPYDYGPYSKEVYEAIELLEEAGLVSEALALGGTSLDELEGVEAGVDKPEGVERRFEVTALGRAIAGKLGSEHPETAKKLASVKGSYGDMPLRQLIRYVYQAFPEYAKASKIREEMLGGAYGRGIRE